MASANTRFSTGYLVRMAVLVAILLLMEFLNFGMIRIPALAVEITIMQIPVVIGAMILGPAAGGILGGVFGLLSFWECFGKSAFGVILFGINPLYTFLICMLPRILMGLLCGLIFKALHTRDRTETVSFFVAGLSGALLNTAFFMALLILLFGKTEFIMNMRGELSILPFIIFIVGINGLVEAIVCTGVGGVCAKALARFLPVTQRR